MRYYEVFFLHIRAGVKEVSKETVDVREKNNVFGSNEELSNVWNLFDWIYSTHELKVV